MNNSQIKQDIRTLKKIAKVSKKDPLIESIKGILIIMAFIYIFATNGKPTTVIMIFTPIFIFFIVSRFFINKASGLKPLPARFIKRLDLLSYDSKKIIFGDPLISLEGANISKYEIWNMIDKLEDSIKLKPVKKAI